MFLYSRNKYNQDGEQPDYAHNSKPHPVVQLRVLTRDATSGGATIPSNYMRGGCIAVASVLGS